MRKHVTIAALLAGVEVGVLGDGNLSSLPTNGSKLILNISGSNFGPSDTNLNLFKLNLIGAYSNGSVAWTSKGAIRVGYSSVVMSSIDGVGRNFYFQLSIE